LIPDPSIAEFLVSVTNFLMFCVGNKKFALLKMCLNPSGIKCGCRTFDPSVCFHNQFRLIAYISGKKMYVLLKNVLDLAFTELSCLIPNPSEHFYVHFQVLCFAWGIFVF
jgi:hypothetical protein